MQNIITRLCPGPYFSINFFMMLITSWPKTNWKGTFNTGNLILNRNLQWLRPFITRVFCLNLPQFDYILYFSVSCFNISCLLKYEPKIDFLELADGNVCHAITRSSPGPSPLRALRCVGLWLKHERVPFLNWPCRPYPNHFSWSQGPQLQVWTQRGDRAGGGAVFLFLNFPWWPFKVSVLLKLLILLPVLRLLHSQQKPYLLLPRENRNRN